MNTVETTLPAPTVVRAGLRTVEPSGPWAMAGWSIVAVAALETAYVWPGAPLVVLIYLFALLQMARAATWRLAFYPALAVGLLIAILQLGFFWEIFSGGAVAVTILIIAIGCWKQLTRKRCLPTA